MDQINSNSQETTPPPAAPQPPDVAKVQVVADALGKPPPFLTSGFARTCADAAQLLGGKGLSPDDLSANLALQAYRTVEADPLPNDQVIPGSTFKFGDAYDVVRNLAMDARNEVFGVVNDVTSFVARAQVAGFAPPSNPFPFIAQLNAGRKNGWPVQVSLDEAQGLVENMLAFVKLLAAEKAGTIDFTKHMEDTAQVTNTTFSLDGFGGTGDTSLDLSQILPDADAVKRKKADDLAAALDFKKRIPRLLFTGDYKIDRKNAGALVGWRRIPEASGYVIRRKNMFSGDVLSFVLSNDEINSRFAHIEDYVKTWVFSFYDNFDEKNVCVFLDASVVSDCFYLYTVQAYKDPFSSLTPSVFYMKTTPTTLSPIQRKLIQDTVKKINEQSNQKGSVNQGVNGALDLPPDTVSPYPVFAKVLLGNDQYDWILAGLNVRAAYARNDPEQTIKGYSYLTAQTDFLLAQADKGLLILPSDPISVFAGNVSQALSSTGVSNVIRSVLNDTGILSYFDGKDQNSGVFEKVGVTIDESPLLSTIFSAIDVDTATVNIATLAANMPQLLSKGLIPAGTGLDAPGAPSTVAQPTEMDVPANVNQIDQTNSEDRVQFQGQVDTSAILDLTTFDGLSKFVRTIRIYSDLGPFGGSSVPAPNSVPVPDSIPSASQIQADNSSSSLPPVDSSAQASAQTEAQSAKQDAKQDQIDQKKGGK